MHLIPTTHSPLLLILCAPGTLDETGYLIHPPRTLVSSVKRWCKHVYLHLRSGLAVVASSTPEEVSAHSHEYAQQTRFFGCVSSSNATHLILWESYHLRPQEELTPQLQEIPHCSEQQHYSPWQTRDTGYYDLMWWPASSQMEWPNCSSVWQSICNSQTYFP